MTTWTAHHGADRFGATDPSFAERHHAWAVALAGAVLLLLAVVSGLLIGELLVTLVRFALSFVDPAGGTSSAPFVGPPPGTWS